MFMFVLTGFCFCSEDLKVLLQEISISPKELQFLSWFDFDAGLREGSSHIYLSFSL